VNLRLVAGDHAQHVLQLLYRLFRGVRNAQPLGQAELLVHIGDQRQQHPAARAEVQVHGLAAHACIPAHILELGFVPTLQALPGRLQQAFARFLSPSPLGEGPGGGFLSLH
jgi:hypothetical protein